MELTTSRSDLSGELKSAVRSFESGLFEDAASRFLTLLRQDPANAEAGYFLRLIERRMASPPPLGPTTLIWQFDPAHAWERDWVLNLLSGSVQAEVVDTRWTSVAPRMVVVDNGLVDAKASYYRAAFDRGCRIVLVHLSDESFRDDTGAYRYCEAVLRNYRSELLATFSRVHFFPLGYKAGFAHHGCVARPAASRRYLWSFAGDVKKSTRRPMLEAMSRLPRGFVHLTEGFGSADSLSTEAYRSLVDDTILVPCPGGWSNLETFRVYEALEAGCVPIVERRPAFDYYTDLLGAHPLPTVSRWAEVPDLFSDRTVEELESIRLACESWWRAFKRRLRTTLAATVLDALG